MNPADALADLLARVAAAAVDLLKAEKLLVKARAPKPS